MIFFRLFLGWSWFFFFAFLSSLLLACLSEECSAVEDLLSLFSECISHLAEWLKRFFSLSLSLLSHLSESNYIYLFNDTPSDQFSSLQAMQAGAARIALVCVFWQRLYRRVCQSTLSVSLCSLRSMGGLNVGAPIAQHDIFQRPENEKSSVSIK